jgi:hypothetical protein
VPATHLRVDAAGRRAGPAVIDALTAAATVHCIAAANQDDDVEYAIFDPRPLDGRPAELALQTTVIASGLAEDDKAEPEDDDVLVV